MSVVEVDEPLVSMLGIEKSFPGVHALKGVDLELNAGEVLALLGENGAGKSTLIKVLSGIERPDKGEILFNGRSIQLDNPVTAHAAGIAVIHQELNLVPELAVWENISLGRESNRWLVNRAKERQRAAGLFERLRVKVPIDAPCGQLSIAQQQIVEIAKALAFDMRLIIMDEPSAAITPKEVEHLFDVIDDLKRQGIGIIYISHRLDEIKAIADRVMVLRDGEHVKTVSIDQAERSDIISWMVGRSMEEEFPKRKHRVGETRLIAEGLTRKPYVDNVSLTVAAGEILGLTGLVGAGRTELARLIFGADRRESGSLKLDGRPLVVRNPRHAIQAGICLLTEDRKNQGLVLDLSLRTNFGLPNAASLSRMGWLSPKPERKAFDDYQQKLNIRLHSSNQLARTLSGGNQQKLVLAKWLQRNANVVIFDEPTRGIDVGAKYEIYLLINQLAADGKGIILISSEMPEVLGMSDRILVMHEGRIRGEITEPVSATQEQILELSLGEAAF